MPLGMNAGHKQGLIAAVVVIVGCLVCVDKIQSAAAESTTSVSTQTDASYTPSADPMELITVGPRDRFGQETFGDKAASGVISGLVGGALGSSGSKSSQSDQPKTRRDPSRKLDYATVAHQGGDPETGARALMTDDGLLVSTRIEDDPDHGTFQTVFLQSCDGRRLYPQRFEIYKLWVEHSISVSWSKTTTSNNQVVSRETGGWNDSWTEDFGAFDRASGENSPQQGAVWQQMGFDRAQGGVRQLGAYFNVSPAELAELGDLSLFVHTTQPVLDPVTTVASNWLVSGSQSGQSLELAAGSSSAAWQDWSTRCKVVMESGGAAPEPQTNFYPVTPGLHLGRPLGTGRTTGHIADIEVRNEGTQPVDFPAMSLYIPSNGKYQSYVVTKGSGDTVAPGTTQTVPIKGYCTDVRKPAVPAGEAMPPVSEWIIASDPDQAMTAPPGEGEALAGRALVPGTGQPVPRVIDQYLEPERAAPLLLGALSEIEAATAKLQEDGTLQTPFGSNPEREREAVVQQTFWIYAAELGNQPYTKEEFTERLDEQYEQRTGVAVASAPPEDRERMEQGADDFWGAFELVGAEAKVLALDETPPPEKQTPPAESKSPGCVPDKDTEHSDKEVDVNAADSYGNEEDRKKIREGIKKAVESEQEAYATSTPPATSYAIWAHDHVGGISSAYAKTVFLKKNSQDWVWSTDPMSTSASGTGTHTLSFTHGPECTAVVAGAALMWFKASSEAFDPLEQNIEIFRALDKVKEVTVEYLADKLPPGLDDALEAGVEAITDPSSDTYAAATGSATLTVGDDELTEEAVNRVVYKRKGKEDKAIVGGGVTIKKFSVSDAKPDSLTSILDASAKLEAGATGNGLAKAYLESMYGTILIGVCDCPSGIRYDVLTDNGMFIRSEATKQVVERAIKEMNEAAERIGKAIKDGELKPSQENLKKRAEQELQDWGESIGGDRFTATEDP